MVLIAAVDVVGATEGVTAARVVDDEDRAAEDEGDDGTAAVEIERDEETGAAEDTWLLDNDAGDPFSSLRPREKSLERH